MNKVQTITLAGEEYAIVPLAEYDALTAAAEEDALDSAIIRRVLDDPDREWLPAELIERMVDGESPARVWREHRGMTATALAAASGVAASYLSAIETGKKPGSVNALKRIAAALNVALDDLV